MHVIGAMHPTEADNSAATGAGSSSSSMQQVSDAEREQKYHELMSQLNNV